MKKTIVMLLTIQLVLGMIYIASAESGWDFTLSTDIQQYDDVQIGQAVSIDTFGELTFTDFALTGEIGFYQAGNQTVGSTDDYYRSGDEAQFAVLTVDIVNTQSVAYDYLQSYEVRAYDGRNTYGGWAFQKNFNNSIVDDISYGVDSGLQNTNWVINAADNYAIQPSDTGHYVFGCTLPNTVIDGQGQLKLSFTIENYELVYYLRQAEQDALVDGLINVDFNAPSSEEEQDYMPFEEDDDMYYAVDQYIIATGGDTNVRTGPGLGYSSLGVIVKGGGANYLNESSIDDRGVAWYKIDYYGTEAWVSSKYTTLRDGTWSGGGSSNADSNGGTSYVKGTSGKSHVRTGPGLSYPDVGVLHKGDTATFLNETSTDDRGVVWYKISWKGEPKWVSSKYTTLY